MSVFDLYRKLCGASSAVPPDSGGGGGGGGGGAESTFIGEGVYIPFTPGRNYRLSGCGLTDAHGDYIASHNTAGWMYYFTYTSPATGTQYKLECILGAQSSTIVSNWRLWKGTDVLYTGPVSQSGSWCIYWDGVASRGAVAPIPTITAI